MKILILILFLILLTVVTECYSQNENLDNCDSEKYIFDAYLFDKYELGYQLLNKDNLLNNNYAQEVKSVNSNNNKKFYYIFLEGGGQGLASINYEQSVYDNMSVRLGYGFFIPLLVNYYIGEEYQFELGVGLAYSPFKILTITNKEKTLLYSITIGHKYQPIYGGLTFRFSFTPLYNQENNRFQIMGGISIGKSYK